MTTSVAVARTECLIERRETGSRSWSAPPHLTQNSYVADAIFHCTNVVMGYMLRSTLEETSGSPHDG